MERQQKKELLSRGCNVSNYQTFHYKNQAERDKSLISLLFCFEGEVLKRIGGEKSRQVVKTVWKSLVKGLFFLLFFSSWPNFVLVLKDVFE